MQSLPTSVWLLYQNMLRLFCLLNTTFTKWPVLYTQRLSDYLSVPGKLSIVVYSITVILGVFLGFLCLLLPLVFVCSSPCYSILSLKGPDAFPWPNLAWSGSAGVDYFPWQSSAPVLRSMLKILWPQKWVWIFKATPYCSLSLLRLVSLCFGVCSNVCFLR